MGQDPDGDNGTSDRERRETDRRAESLQREADALRARLDKLSDALAEQRSAPLEHRGAGPSPKVMGSALSLAFRVLSEFVAAVIVGAAIGWGADRLAGTSPLFLVTFLLMGAAAGFWNVYRIATEKPGAESR